MTRAERLDAITARFGPRAKYVIHTMPEGGRKIVLTNPDTDDQVAGRGKTIDEAIAALDAKVPAAPAEGAAQ